MKRSWAALSGLGMALAGFAGCGDGSPAPSPPDAIEVIKVGTVLPEAHPTSASLAFLKKRFAELSGGSMSVELHFDAMLGDPTEMLESCRDGTIGIAHVSAADLTGYIRIANALAMPFIWRDLEHQRRLLDGDVGQIVREAARVRSFEILGYLDAGFRSLTTKKGPIVRPADLAGMYIRTMPAQVMSDTIVSFGAFPTPMNQDEVYSALESGSIDGWENNPITIATFHTYDVGCNHLAWTRHLSIPDVLVAGRPFLDRLTERQRKWFDQAVRETIGAQREMWQQAEERAVAELVAHGMKINDVDIEPFRAKVRPIYERYYRRYGAEFQALCEQILGLVPTATAPVATRPAT